MKMRLYTWFALAGIFVLCGWNIYLEKQIKKAEWLLGTWENNTSGSSIYESWLKVSDDEFSGLTYILKKGDTVVFENIRLVQENDTLFYIPAVKDQNKGMSVRFALNTISDTEMVFENSKHDFPQIISYRRINADSLVAEISGMKKGREQKQIFPMKRVN